MRNGQVEVIKVARRDTNLEFQDLGSNMNTVIHPNMEDGIRKALVADHKERQAAKKAERRFYVGRQMADTGLIPVWDRDFSGGVGEPIEQFRNGGNALAFAKLLNKQARKEAGQ